MGLSEYQVLQQQMRAMKFSTSTSLGHNSKASVNKEKAWSMGTDFNDCYSKYKSKSRVLSELEMAAGKELAKAQAVLSSIFSGLKDEPGFIETSFLSISTQ